ncbi:MAG: S41 family peptidase [Ginsengibacter sp.]
MKIIFFFTVALCFLRAGAQTISSQQYRDDYTYFCNTIDKNYCYWDKKQTDWNKVKNDYSPVVDTIHSKESFILLLEKLFYELYDHHASLSANTSESQKLVPSGTDVWAEYLKNKPIIIEVRKGSGADDAGLKAGMEVTAFNDVPIETALLPFFPKSLKKSDPEAKNYALRILLAGNHIDQRKLTMRYSNKVHDFFPDEKSSLEAPVYSNEIESKRLKGNTGYIRINNNLGDNHLILLFDSVLRSLKDTKALILDLRETPSGGNTIVARSILGSFISKEEFYQKHELTSEQMEFGIKRGWVEIVSPKKYVYTKPLVILSDHWTGSVAEGITIGFDAIKRATVIGTKMAGLNGAVYSYSMPNTGIGFSIPAEKLFHVNGTPRENYKPRILVDVTLQKKGEDLILKEAMKFLKQNN